MSNCGGSLAAITGEYETVQVAPDDRTYGPWEKIIPPLACLVARLRRYIHPHASRYAQVDVPRRQTTIRRICVALFLTVTLKSA